MSIRRSPSMHVLLGGVLLALSVAACDPAGPAGPAGPPPLAMSASAVVAADSVVFSMEFTNNTDAALELTWGDCPEALGVELSVHPPGFLMPPRWEYAAWRREQACYSIGYGRTLQPQERWVLTRQVRIASILGDSLPPGVYRLTVSAAFREDISRQHLTAGSSRLSID